MVKSYEWAAVIALCILALVMALAACAPRAPQAGCAFQPGDMVTTRLHGATGMVTWAGGNPCVYNVKFNAFTDEVRRQAWQLDRRP